jgi:Tol biopolymer transport system component
LSAAAGANWKAELQELQRGSTKQGKAPALAAAIALLPAFVLAVAWGADRARGESPLTPSPPPRCDEFGRTDIFAINANGSGKTGLTKSSAYESDPAWSPNGRRIAFDIAQGSPGQAEIFVMEADGSRPKNLTRDPANDQDPAWSPNGRKIAFTRRSAADPFGEIFVMDADGSGQTNVTNHPAPDAFSTWSPDGTKLAFASNRGNLDVYVMNADGSGQTSLTSNVEDDYDPAWSPDGKRIAFVTALRDRPHQVFVMNADGSGQRNLTDDPRHASLGPSWSPDGRKIAFTTNRGTGSCYDIFVMDADGGNLKNLTNDRAADSSPTWSPDGRRIAYTSFGRCWVPNVVGRPLRSARTAIRRENCSVGRIDYARSPHARGRVLRQRPSAASTSPRPTRLRRGGPVHLVVSRGRR